MRSVTNVELADVHGWDAPDFSDAYVAYAEYEDGTPLTEDELEGLSAHDYLGDYYV